MVEQKPQPETGTQCLCECLEPQRAHYRRLNAETRTEPAREQLPAS